MKDDTIELINHDDFNDLTTDNLKLSKNELKAAKERARINFPFSKNQVKYANQSIRPKTGR